MTDSPGRPAGAPSVLDEALDTVPVELRFVVAQRGIPTAEAMSLREGQVLTFSDALPPPVLLLAGDTVVARGDLVNVDGRRAVRVAALMEPMP